MRLNNKIALVTGGASGIWLEIAKLFEKEGAFIYLADINKQALENAQKLIKNSKAIYLNVTDEENWKEVFNIIVKEKWKIDILINNAWVTGFHRDIWAQDPENISLSAWNEVHNINLNGTMLWCKYALQNMKKNGGNIVNLSSRSGIVWVPMASAYASSKAAIRNHTKSVCLYAAKNWYNIRCNSLHPAAIMTPMWEAMLWDEKEKREKELSQDIPMKRFWKPEEVAYSALFLASDESSYINWSELNIDGWILAWTETSPWE